MRKIFFILVFCLTLSVSFGEEIDPDTYYDMKQSAFALYNTNNLNEAKKILDSIPDEKKDEEIYLILSNIDEELNHGYKSVELLKEGLKKNPEFYKAYYNLGRIYMQRRIYTLATENFELAVQYNKKSPWAYYNLGCTQMYLGDYKSAKKNLIKAITLKNDEKDFYYNLAFANKKLGKEKEAQKIIEFYNSTFVK